ncbi:hypothetical protein M569_01325 [Genlisea aurea]|uniref:Uncharacterized protein n=1 Tax=Genlisea aurea TaxID=192259 RepID=S8D7M1_9LAMI|nr:hypothetical protein M569_01325 [Genlisea aurea]
MLSDVLLRPFRCEKKSKRKVCKCMREHEGEEEIYPIQSVPFHKDRNADVVQLRSMVDDRNGRRPKTMTATKVSNFSDLIHRVTASCLLHPLAGVSRPEEFSASEDGDNPPEEEEEEEDEEDFTSNGYGEEERREQPKMVEIQILVTQVFEAVSTLKKAYIGLQEAHCPWDAEKMRAADVAVVAELQRLCLLRERFRRSAGGGGRSGRWNLGAATLKEVVAPYEEAVQELKREVKARQMEVDNLREKLKTATFVERISGKSKGKSKRRVSCYTQVATAPAVELFEATMSLVKDASKGFTTLLLSLMRSANWDIAAAVRSIEAASSAVNFNPYPAALTLGANHARYALESYVNRKIFLGFDHETFYMDGSLSSILHPDQHRRDCFTQYRDMKAMDPIELLGILPTCAFGNFCFKKYLSIVHPKMEESLFGDMEQRQQVLDGHHPRSSPFYREFVGLAKSVWLLHLLAFSLDPPPSHFEASRGAEFHAQYMEGVVKTNVNGGSSMIVGISVSPGFKLGNGSIIKARVYLIPKTN